MMRRSLKSRWILLLPVGLVVACSFSSSNHGGSGTTPDAATPAPAAGGTGAFGIVTVDGKQKMYLPQKPTFDVDAGSEVATISVVDVSVAGNGVAGAPALIHPIVLPTPANEDADVLDGETPYATATGGDSSIILAVSTEFPIVWFIDPHTDTVTGTLTLDGTYGRSEFSGGGGYVTGVTVDSAHQRAILSVWNGFAILDLNTKTIATVIQAPPSENFGFDSVAQKIYAPFYSCSSSSNDAAQIPSSCNTPMSPDGNVMSDGLSVIDLTDPAFPVYTYQYPVDDPAEEEEGPTEDLPVGSEPDSASADPSTGVVVVPSEGDGYQNVIDFSKATFDKTTMSVVAPNHPLATTGRLTGVAIEPTSHLALFESESDQYVAVADLTTANQGDSGYVYATMPDLPDESSFSNIGDPHGIAVSIELLNGSPVGFLVDSNLQWVARIDLVKFHGGVLPDAASLDYDASYDVSGDGGVADCVTYLDALTPE